MSWLQAIITLLVALLGGVGSSYFSYRQFILKRKDEKEEKSIQKQIDDSIETAMKRFIDECGEIGDKEIEKAKEEVRKELQVGLEMRGEEGKERFDLNSKQIEANSRQINEILIIVKDQAQKYDAMAESLTALNTIVKASAESQRNSNYDRLLIVTNKVLKSGKMTISDKTNIKQLYNSWKELGGEDPTSKMETMYDECMKMTPIPDEGT